MCIISVLICCIKNLISTLIDSVCWLKVLTATALSCSIAYVLLLFAYRFKIEIKMKINQIKKHVIPIKFYYFWFSYIETFYFNPVNCILWTCVIIKKLIYPALKTIRELSTCTSLKLASSILTFKIKLVSTMFTVKLMLRKWEKRERYV